MLPKFLSYKQPTNDSPCWPKSTQCWQQISYWDLDTSNPISTFFSLGNGLSVYSPRLRATTGW